MGQFLAIGITTKIAINKSEIDKAKLNFNQVMEKMKDNLFFEPAIYTQSDNENYLVFVLKDDIFRMQLIDLLKKIYPALYKEADRYNEVLNALSSMESSRWMEWAERKTDEAFQFDPYGMSDYLSCEFGNRIEINYESIMLSLEGKIIMEEYGRQFLFFKYSMVHAFKQFSLSNALRVYITG